MARTSGEGNGGFPLNTDDGTSSQSITAGGAQLELGTFSDHDNREVFALFDISGSIVSAVLEARDAASNVCKVQVGSPDSSGRGIAFQQGTNTSFFIVGSGAPTVIGSIGALYVDVSTPDLYICAGPSTWKKITRAA